MSAEAHDIQVHKAAEQLTTFYIDGSLFGLEVMNVQEVTGPPQVFHVPLAPNFVRGLINLRGQIATALGLRELLGRPSIKSEDQMSVVCKLDGNLVSMIVDSIGDVLEVDQTKFEQPPDTLPPEVRRYVKGVYKINNALLSLLDLEVLSKELSTSTVAMAADKI